LFILSEIFVIIPFVSEWSNWWYS